ncbi:epidermal growth factor receptor kinase substrate 8-like isoform X2 [Artemia franciscana]|uniref:epidermal growth factor receptor kinase substrate 8-like isoform X2 n=1 Tax=Artemia franciscana TaxID=6661 RepID=UPI0032DA1D76
MSIFGGTSISNGSYPLLGDTSSEYSLFFVEHLATFTINNVQIPPKLVLERLFRSPPQPGIWTKEKLQVRIDSEFILYLDPQDGKILERFPLTLVHLPTYAFQQPDPKQKDVSNIFMFAVSSKDGQPEMHILQCLNVHAVHVAEDLNAAVKSAIAAEKAEYSNLSTASIVNGRHKQLASLLNKCFDDIEAFVAKVLEASRRPVPVQQPNGMVNISVVLPAQKDFIDVYQKHKFCFNLIAKMKESLFDPNGPDLIHVLFNTLTIILESSQDYRLPTTVVSPLLTQDSVDLLYSCLKSEQVALWHSLGDGWNIPREKWNGYVPPYHPTFLDGWTPDYSVQHEEQDNKPPSSLRSLSPASSLLSFDTTTTSPNPVPMKTKPNWAEDLKNRDVKVLEVQESKFGKEPRELTVIKGELLEMVSDDKTHGIWCRNSGDQFGFVDPSIVAIYNFNQVGSARKTTETSPYSSSPPQPKALPPPPPPPPPANYMADLIKEPESSDNDSLSVDESQPRRRGKVMYRSPSQQELVLAELSSVLNELDRKKLHVKKTPEVFISKYSTPEEVQEWLEAKEFGTEIRKKLRTFNGDSLFQLRKEQCEKKFGKEGSRLFSQITLQRKINNIESR